MNATLTAVPGLRVGHWTAEGASTGVTVVRADCGAVGGHIALGGGTGSREWGAMDPDHVVQRIHAVCLSGGSAFGLGSADGVMAVLAAEGIGHPTRHGPVPIVPAAILYDLDGGAVRPDAASGAAATRAASDEPVEAGRVGAGAGARVGRAFGLPAPGGVGSAARTVGAFTVGALAVVNAVGMVVDPATGQSPTHPEGVPEPSMADVDVRSSTTLVVVGTDASLDRGGARRVAVMASAGLARCLVPAFTPFDGDVVFVLGTGTGPPEGPEVLARLGHHAAELVVAAVLDAVRPR